MRRTIDSRLKEGTLHLYSVLVRLFLDQGTVPGSSAGSSSGLPRIRDVQTYWRESRKRVIIEMMKTQEHFSREEMLVQFRLEKAQRILTNVCGAK